ncbi:MAG: hypothetical protein MZW92_31195 [Comamonadaceae bacterium]|nr:hypothetical protein [Comamonadaceae bacterium]
MKRGEVSFSFDEHERVCSVIQTIFGDILRVNYIVDPSRKGQGDIPVRGAGAGKGRCAASYGGEC